MNQRKIDMVIKRLRKWPKEFNFQNANQLDKDLLYYFNYYQLPIENTSVHVGKKRIGNKKIMLYMFSPPNPNGTVVLVHGYFDHVGHMRHAIDMLLEDNKRVIGYDLEGHGLSEGNRASIDDFDDYRQSFNEIVNETVQYFEGPVYLIAHSTGGAITLSYLLDKKTNPFKRVIVVAPLIRSHLWHLSKWSYYLFQPFLKKLKRKFRRNTSNKKYLEWVKEDPLQYNFLPLKWFGALIKYVAYFSNTKPTDQKLYVIQGEKDKTVDWKYNLQLIQQKFTCARFYIIPNGKHHLLNEENEIQTEVLTIIKKILDLEES